MNGVFTFGKSHRLEEGHGPYLDTKGS